MFNDPLEPREFPDMSDYPQDGYGNIFLDFEGGNELEENDDENNEDE